MSFYNRFLCKQWIVFIEVNQYTYDVRRMNIWDAILLSHPLCINANSIWLSEYMHDSVLEVPIIDGKG